MNTAKITNDRLGACIQQACTILNKSSLDDVHIRLAMVGVFIILSSEWRQRRLVNEVKIREQIESTLTNLISNDRFVY
jgi:hypothetical protein